MKIYTPESPPETGRAKRIWDAIHETGLYKIKELNYNANLWGRGQAQGYGTWACALTNNDGSGIHYRWCGESAEGIYLGQTEAPYYRALVKKYPCPAKSDRKIYWRTGKWAWTGTLSSNISRVEAYDEIWVKVDGILKIGTKRIQIMYHGNKTRFVYPCELYDDDGNGNSMTMGDLQEIVATAQIEELTDGTAKNPEKTA